MFSVGSGIHQTLIDIYPYIESSTYIIREGYIYTIGEVYQWKKYTYNVK